MVVFQGPHESIKETLTIKNPALVSQDSKSFSISLDLKESGEVIEFLAKYKKLRVTDHQDRMWVVEECCRVMSERLIIKFKGVRLT